MKIKNLDASHFWALGHLLMLQNWLKPIKGHNGPVPALNVIPEPGRTRVKTLEVCTYRGVRSSDAKFPSLFSFPGIGNSRTSFKISAGIPQEEVQGKSSLKFQFYSFLKFNVPLLLNKQYTIKCQG